jgi:hypothetical protein
VQRGGGSILGLIPVRNQVGYTFTLSEVGLHSLFDPDRKASDTNEAKLSLLFTAVFTIDGWNSGNPEFREAIGEFSRYSKEFRGSDDFHIIDLRTSPTIQETANRELARRKRLYAKRIAEALKSWPRLIMRRDYSHINQM